jgi:hypothetical protein
MAQPKITVTLDRERRIAWSNRAIYRLGSLARPPSLRDLTDGRKVVSATMAFIWAMLVDGAEDFASPEEVAEHVNIEAAHSYVEKVIAAIPKKDDERKNDDGSTPSPSPASSSV